MEIAAGGLAVPGPVPQLLFLSGRHAVDTVHGLSDLLGVFLKVLAGAVQVDPPPLFELLFGLEPLHLPAAVVESGTGLAVLQIGALPILEAIPGLFPVDLVETGVAFPDVLTPGGLLVPDIQAFVDVDVVVAVDIDVDVMTVPIPVAPECVAHGDGGPEADDGGHRVVVGRMVVVGRGGIPP